MEKGTMMIVGYEPTGEPIVGWFGSTLVKKAGKVLKKAAPVAALVVPGVGVPLAVASGQTKKTVQLAGKVGRNPFAKATAAGLAFVAPPAGIGASAALAAADKVAAAVERGEAGALNIAKATYLAAKQGDPHAKKGLALLATAKRQRVAVRRIPAKAGDIAEGAILVTKDGLLSHGTFKKA